MKEFINNQEEILCIGEILWDALPSGLYLGGALLNSCYHLNQFNVEATVASRVGDDRLGREATKRISRMGIDTTYIQKDQKLETGFVNVELSQSGDPDYDIIKPAAWDFISLTDSLQELAENCWGMVFGLLAQRSEISRQTIQRLWRLNINMIFDVNLRPPYIDKGIINQSLSISDIVKMNEEELNQLKDWFCLSGNTLTAVEELATKFKCSMVCITRGANGALLYEDGFWFEHNGYPVKVRDAVGAGDAFLAAFLYGIKSGREKDEVLALANATGSVVAQRNGATPNYNIEVIKSMINR